MEDRKKNIEREILYSVYRNDIIEELTRESETPDFTITDKKNRKIGVEITRIFSSKASSILWKSEKFKDDFIKNHLTKKKKKIPRHLRKIQVIKVEGGEELIEHGHAIVYEQSLTEFFAFFETLINKKSSSYEKKQSDLSFVCLIAKDEEDFLRNAKLPIKKLYGFLRQFSIFDSILKSNFQEITLLASFDSGKYHIPLYWLIFINEFQTFRFFWDEKIKILDQQKTNLNFFSNLIIVLLNLGFKNIYLANDKNDKIIVIGTKYLRINLDNGDFKEESFLALEISNLLKAEIFYKKYANYQSMYSEYLKFRSKYLPLIEEDHFNKISD